MGSPLYFTAAQTISIVCRNLLRSHVTARRGRRVRPASRAAPRRPFRHTEPTSFTNASHRLADDISTTTPSNNPLDQPPRTPRPSSTTGPRDVPNPSATLSTRGHPTPCQSGHHTPSTSRFVYPGGSWGNLIEHERERMQRAVAQLGSALDWGSSGRRFKSCQPDQEIPFRPGSEGDFCYSTTRRFRANLGPPGSSRR